MSQSEKTSLSPAERSVLFLKEMGLAPTWQLKQGGAVAPAEAILEDAAAVPAPLETAQASTASTTVATTISALETAPVTLPEVAPAMPQEAPAEQASVTTDAPTDAPTRTVSRAPNNAIATLDWNALSSTVAACTQCGLCKTRTQTVLGVGHPQADWMVIGEAPGEQEDLQGEPFVGQAGKLLDNMLAAIGVARRPAVSATASQQSAYIANVLKCRPPQNRDPAPDEVAQCQPYLHRQIALIQPKVILVVGRFAAQTLLQTDVAIGKLRGKVHTYQGEHGAIPVIVTYHPAYLLRTLSDKAKAWEDLCLAKATFAQAVADAPNLAAQP